MRLLIVGALEGQLTEATKEMTLSQKMVFFRDS